MGMGCRFFTASLNMASRIAKETSPGSDPSPTFGPVP